MQTFPRESEDIEPISTLWEDNCSFTTEDGAAELTQDQIAQTLYVDKLRMLNALAVMQASIACRAVRTCDMYFDWMKKRRGTDKETYLRPRVRIDSRYFTVEMAWVRRLSKSKPSSQNAKSQINDSKVGRAFTIKTESGMLDVFAWYKYIKKGVKERYSNSIFEKEPIWVQKLGPEIEDRFELLRKEQKTLTAMKRLIGTLDSLQAKQFDERVMAELQAWNEGQPLKALYSPKIVLDSSAEDS